MRIHDSFAPRTSIGVEADEPQWLDTQIRLATKGCGASCLSYLSMRLTDDECSYREAVGLVDPDGDGICSLADLVRGLETIGIEAIPLSKGTEELPAGISLLHVKSSEHAPRPDHFIVSERSDSGISHFYFPGAGSAHHADVNILDLWEGVYLRLEKPSGGSLFIAPAIALVACVFLGSITRLLGRAGQTNP